MKRKPFWFITVAGIGRAIGIRIVTQGNWAIKPEAADTIAIQVALLYFWLAASTAL
ncbi:MAG: hypothetical protein ONB48_19300 [candidate division KSB1 bacterium]|nr:hypothetical protein [candidate division KSB1 bacterium]MDZ7274162.1 hypothetical protein [candidate division KSB1 bacterium]MDZ7287793.1 hypothetical protein [candidate division KSB1 bacterium]MDZ7296761.1 hypothetical protein [candidate division KSB1 bacterium]MDZ7347627.1 hypothetical protein [candidate division KSB1 bacterium]